jgi:AcrR family transcriptional regulator
MRLTPHQREIAEKAGEVFRSKGIHARTREIAEAVGYSEAWIFRHFKSKEEIFVATQSLLEERVLAHIDAFCAQPPSTSRVFVGLDTLIEHVVIRPAQDPLLALSMANVFALDPVHLPHARAFMERSIVRFLTSWERSYVLACDAGLFLNHADTPLAVLVSVHNLLFGASSFRAAGLAIVPRSLDDDVRALFASSLQLLGVTRRGRTRAAAHAQAGVSRDR